MEDYVNPDWIDAIEIGFNSTIGDYAKSIVKFCNENVVRYGNQWRCDIGGKTAILLKPGEGYEWHFDNLDFTDGKLNQARKNRYWTHIIYLTEGKPLEIGTWNPASERVKETDFSAPKPENIIARVYPKPGKTTVFPCFMVHRIQPIVDNYRWAFVDFVTTPNYHRKTIKDLNIIFNRYFDENSRSQLLSPR